MVLQKLARIIRVRGVGLGLLLGVLLLAGSAPAQSPEDEQQLYARFNQALASGDLEQAEQLAKEFAKAYPDSAHLQQMQYELALTEPDYGKALNRLEEIIDGSEASRWIVLAGTRIALLARLESRMRDAVVALREAERKGAVRGGAAVEPQDLQRLRLEMARAYLSLGRESAAAQVLERLENPEQLSPLDQEAYAFCLALILWGQGEDKQFWQQVLAFEERFPESSYLPSLQFIASGYPLRRRTRRPRVDRELLQEIVDFFPNSPEAYVARRALSSM